MKAPLRDRLECESAAVSLGEPRTPEAYERLRDLLLEAASELAAAEARAAELLSGIRGRNNTIDRLTAENERPREALERIARLDVEFFTGTTRGCIKIARAALTPKHPQDEQTDA